MKITLHVYKRSLLTLFCLVLQAGKEVCKIVCLLPGVFFKNINSGLILVYFQVSQDTQGNSRRKEINMPVKCSFVFSFGLKYYRVKVVHYYYLSYLQLQKQYINKPSISESHLCPFVHSRENRREYLA